MNKKITVSSILIVLVWGLCCTSFAVAEDFVQPIKTQNYQGIPYISSGISVDERRVLESMARQYSLKLSFSVQGGEYLADVELIITDAERRQVKHPVDIPGVSAVDWITDGRLVADVTEIGIEVPVLILGHIPAAEKDVVVDVGDRV